MPEPADPLSVPCAACLAPPGEPCYSVSSDEPRPAPHRLRSLAAGDRERFEGHDGRECGEHRTTGHRAWCFDCSEWCYSDIPCRGCELPSLRQRAEEAERERDDYRQRFANQMTAATELTTTLREAERQRAEALEAVAAERRDKLAAQAAVRRARPAIESVRRGLATTSRDMATNRTDAWLYAVFLGWDCDHDHEHTDDCDAMTEVANQHGWNPETVARLREYRAAIAALDAEPPRDEALDLLREITDGAPCTPHPGTGWCQTHGQRPPCPHAAAMGLLAALDGTEERPPGQERAVPVDWEAIARQRERELKREGEARHQAEAAVQRVRRMAQVWIDIQPTHQTLTNEAHALAYAGEQIIAALDAEQPPRTEEHGDYDPAIGRTNPMTVPPAEYLDAEQPEETHDQP